MYNFNQNYFGFLAFLTVGLVWSGGHVAWLIALGVFVALGFLGSVAVASGKVK